MCRIGSPLGKPSLVDVPHRVDNDRGGGGDGRRRRHLTSKYFVGPAGVDAVTGWTVVHTAVFGQRLDVLRWLAHECSLGDAEEIEGGEEGAGAVPGRSHAWFDLLGWEATAAGAAPPSTAGGMMMTSTALDVAAAKGDRDAIFALLQLGAPLPTNTVGSQRLFEQALNVSVAQGFDGQYVLPDACLDVLTLLFIAGRSSDAGRRTAAVELRSDVGSPPAPPCSDKLLAALNAACDAAGYDPHVPSLRPFIASLSDYIARILRSSPSPSVASSSSGRTEDAPLVATAVMAPTFMRRLKEAARTFHAVKKATWAVDDSNIDGLLRAMIQSTHVALCASRRRPPPSEMAEDAHTSIHSAEEQEAVSSASRRLFELSLALDADRMALMNAVKAAAMQRLKATLRPTIKAGEEQLAVHQLLRAPPSHAQKAPAVTMPTTNDAGNAALAGGAVVNDPSGGKCPYFARQAVLARQSEAGKVQADVAAPARQPQKNTRPPVCPVTHPVTFVSHAALDVWDAMADVALRERPAWVPFAAGLAIGAVAATLFLHHHHRAASFR